MPNSFMRNFKYMLFPLAGLIALVIILVMPGSKAHDPGLPLKEVFRKDWKKGFKVNIDSIEYIIVTNGEAISIVKHRDLTRSSSSGEK